MKVWKSKGTEITNALKDRPLNLQNIQIFRDKKKEEKYLKVILANASRLDW